MTAHVDWQRLLDDLDVARERRGLSYAAAARDIGVAPSALLRLREGNAVSADGLAKLVAWLYPKSRPAWITEEAT